MQLSINLDPCPYRHIVQSKFAVHNNLKKSLHTTPLLTQASQKKLKQQVKSAKDGPFTDQAELGAIRELPAPKLAKGKAKL